MKVLCDHKDKCGIADCGARKVHNDNDCEPCPFHPHAKCVEVVVTATTKAAGEDTDRKLEELLGDKT